MQSSDERPSMALLRLIDGYQISQAIAVAAALGVADLLAGGARSSDDLAAACGANPRALYRLLRALASVGVFHEEEGRRFALTSLGDCLRTDMAESLAGLAVNRASQSHWHAWGQLLYSIQTGQNAFRHLFGMSPWEYRAQRPEEEAIFDRGMTSLSRQNTAAVLAAYDFDRFRRVVDVGGGQGALLAGILARHPNLRGVLFDQPAVVARAGQLLREANVAGRCELVGGDFFAAVPEGGDAYLLRFILHDWEDAEASAILRSCRRAIAPDGRLLVIERLIEPPNTGSDGKLADLNMLVNPGGQERTPEEFAALFAGAGFHLARVIPTALDTSIVEALPV
ncbi:MAG TPA: methyltransferase [Thermomicrobiaceae bacterium]|nr:methyltransferase [Thermomicrobiaceae bacterium]